MRLLLIPLIALLVSCSGEDGADGTNGLDGKDGTTINIDSLTSVLDSLYGSLYDSVYADLAVRDVQQFVQANLYSVKGEFNSAFANQYSLMYKNFVSGGENLPVPVAVKVRNFGTTTVKIFVKSWIDGFSDTASVSFLLNPNTDTLAGPALALRPAAYLPLTAPVQATLQVKTVALAYGNEVPLLSDSRIVTIQPPQIFGSELAGINPDLPAWRAVFVTPNMDSLGVLLKDVSKKLIELGGSGDIYGYQAGTFGSVPVSVDKQVQAIYEVLAERGIIYVNNVSAGSLGQKILYPVEVLREKRANCIEGVQLFASILESIGLQAFIIQIPNHAFLAWRVAASGNTLAFLETTMTWGGNHAIYEAAKEEGTSKFNANFTDGQPNAGVTVINISSTRSLGIAPAPVQ